MSRKGRPGKAEGTVYARKKSVFWWVRYRNREGEIVKESTGTQNREEAERFLRERLDARDDGTLPILLTSKTLTFDQAHLERVRRQAEWTSQRTGYRRGVLPVICVARARDTQLLTGGVLIVSPDRLLDALLAANAAA